MSHREEEHFVTEKDGYVLMAWLKKENKLVIEYRSFYISSSTFYIRK